VSLLNTYSIKIAGPAGAGIKSSGLLLAKILIAHGQNVRDYSEYPSLVRGGHNTYQLTFSSQTIFTVHQKIDLFFALAPNHWQQHQSEFTKKTLVIGPDAQISLPDHKFATNTVCLGIVAYIFNLDQKICHHQISLAYSDSSNLDAFDFGYQFAKQSKLKQIKIIKNFKLKIKNSLYDGNEAYGWGFIKGGGKFFAAYPMTPASGSLHFLAQKQVDHQLTVIHPEDEIAAASMVAGAAYTGVKSATGTSGGGFALMTETISFCGVANLGTVFYLVSRPGPATGLPTWTSQGDLLFAINAGHGEFPKIVLAPGDQQESFDLSQLSLNLAAKYSLPVILISDKFISESSASIPDLSVKKIKSVQPQRSFLMANSYEHDQFGYSTESSQVVNQNVKKRLALTKKLALILPKPIIYGPQTATKLIISWGSTKSTILETLTLKKDNDFAFLHFQTLWPINPEIKKLINNFKKIIVIENNATSQLTTLLKSQFDFNPDQILLKFDGRPFFPEELLKKL